MGTSPFAAHILGALHKAHENIVCVYTQPDRPAGRGLKLSESSVKRLATELELPVRQPVNFKDEAAVKELAALEPDFLIVAAYGLILPQAVLDIPRMAPINIHASLLPAFRGAAPIQFAIMDSWRNDITGVSIMRMEKGMDTGPVYATAEVAIEGRDFQGLEQALAKVGADLLLEILPAIASGQLQPVPQEHDKASYTAKITKESGQIDWSSSAGQVDSLIRAMTPWPGARTTFVIDGKSYPVILEPGSLGEKTQAEPGTLNVEKHKVRIACQDQWYVLGALRPEGRKCMEATAFFNGLRLGRGFMGRAL